MVGLIRVIAILLACLATSAAVRAQEGRWSMNEYQALLLQLEDDDAAMLDAQAGSAEWLAATNRGIATRQQLVSLLSESFMDESLPPEFRAVAATERLLFIQNIVVLLASTNQCAAASAAIRSLDVSHQSSDTELLSARQIAEAAVQDCGIRTGQNVTHIPTGNWNQQTANQTVPFWYGIIPEPNTVWPHAQTYTERFRRGHGQDARRAAQACDEGEVARCAELGHLLLASEAPELQQEGYYILNAACSILTSQAGGRSPEICLIAPR